ncbi:MAG: glycoside hydrolase family 28 protein, partial [Bacteroidota bacterium]
MKKILSLLVIISLITLTVVAQDYAKLPWVSKVGAKSFPSGAKVYMVNAVSDTAKVITKNIQAAIDDCAKNGGGIVSFKAGTYVSGSIFL